MRAFYLKGNYKKYDSKIVKVKSSNPAIAIVGHSGYELDVEPTAVGKTTITCTDSLGRKSRIAITVTEAFFKANLKSYTWVELEAGKRTCDVYSDAGAKVTLKVGNDTYSTITKRDYDYLRGHAKVKLKRSYKAGTKIAITAQSSKAKIAKSDKVY